MADINKSIAIQYKADVSNLERGLARTANISQKEAKKIMNALESAYSKAAKAAERSAEIQERKLKEVERQAKKTGSTFKASFKSMAVGATAAAASVGFFIKSVADASNELVDASTKTGVAVDSLAGLRLAAEGSGLSFQNLEVGLIKLPQAMNDAAKGSKAASKAFDDLGVAVTENVDGFEQLRSADEVLKDVFHSLQQVTSEEEKAALASKIFGKTAGPQFIQSGAIDNLEAFTDLARDYGVNLGPNMQEQMASFQRVTSTALMVAQGELSKFLDTLTGAGEGAGLNATIILATESFIYLNSVIGDALVGFRAAFGVIVTGFQAAFLAATGDIASASQIWTEQIKVTEDASEDFFNMFERGSDRVLKFREKLAKTLETPSGKGKPTGEGGQPTIGGATADASKEMIKIDQIILDLERKISAEKLRQRKEAIDKLGPEDKARELIKLRVQEIEKEKEALIEQNFLHQQSLYLLDESEERNERINKHLALHNERLEQYNKEISSLFEQADDLTLEAQLDGFDQLMDKEEELRKTKADNHKKTMEELLEEAAKAATTFQSVTSGYVQAAGLASDLIDRFGEKNRKNAEIAFNIRKGAAIAEISINTAVAITRALSEMGVVLGGLASAGILATGAAQIALVASEQPKFHMGGIIGNQSTLGPDERMIKAKTGEAILDSATVNRLGEDGIRSLQRGNDTSPKIIVMNPFKHYDRFIRSRRLVGIGSTGRGKY